MPDGPRQKVRKGDQTPRMWTVREEEILAATLLLLKARGWISEKGFRAGYLGIIEDRIRTEFPNSGLKARPHIKFKIADWEMSYNALRQILGRTGVRFNLDGDYKIHCDDEQWEQIVQADSQAKGMRTKSWPFWVTWQRVFGKDRPSGGGADRASQQMARGSQCNKNDYHPSHEDFPVVQTPPLAGEEEANKGQTSVRGKSSRESEMQSELLSAQGIPDTPRQKIQKGDQTPPMWTVLEEEILAATLLLLCARGWKSDKGFRAGYLGIIEDKIHTVFPNSDIKGRPHIASKISDWKESYNALRQILGRSGVRFNLDGDYKIECDDEQWEQIVQADPQAKGMRTKSWPFWVTWQRVFGKDRASGGCAEDVDGSADRACQQMAGGSQCNGNDYHPSHEDIPVDQTPPLAEEEDIPDNVSENTEKQMPSTKSGGGKRKQPPSDDPLMEFLANLHAETNARLEVFAARIGYEFDMGKARHELFNTLGTVDGLTLNQRYELCNILADKPQRLEVFMGMAANARLGYVLRLLAHKK